LVWLNGSGDNVALDPPFDVLDHHLARRAAVAPHAGDRQAGRGTHGLPLCWPCVFLLPGVLTLGWYLGGLQVLANTLLTNSVPTHTFWN